MVTVAVLSCVCLCVKALADRRFRRHGLLLTEHPGPALLSAWCAVSQSGGESGLNLVQAACCSQ